MGTAVTFNETAPPLANSSTREYRLQLLLDKLKVRC